VLANQPIQIFDSTGTLLDTHLTNQYGKASFPELAAGEYSICSGAGAELCYTIQLESGQIAELRFTFAATPVNADSAEEARVGDVSVQLSPAPTLPDVQAGSETPNDDDYLNTPEANDTLYLPLVGGGQ
jgi:hypothetical protein